MNEPIGPGTPPAKSNRPTVALIFGIIGIVCCPLCGPIAWVIGKQELDAIAAGRSAKEGEGLARAGMILGIIGTAFIALSLLWIFLWGGMAVLHGAFG
jgi:hypothetical protein